MITEERDFKYILYVPSKSADCGGFFALKKLYKTLILLGQNADIFYSDDCNIKKVSDSSIVIYPEVVSGNPLNAKNVVRWFLNTPGEISGSVNFGNPEDELFFYYAKSFVGSFKDYFKKIEKYESRELFVLDILWDIYKDRGIPLEKRRLKCHMFRKYQNQPFVHDRDSICIDGLPHEKIAKIFSKSKFFISYDLYSFYNIYAALCGCIPIVVPKKGLSKEEWMKHEDVRYGIAYGFEEVEHAIKTRKKLIEHLKYREKKSLDSVKNFIKITKSKFKRNTFVNSYL